MKRAVRGAIVAGVLAWAGSAHADTPPSVWERAADPQVADDFAVHEQAMARLDSLLPDHDGSGFRSPAIAISNEGLLRGLIAMLQSAGAEHSKTALLRFDLAEAYEELGSRLKVPGAYEHAAALFKSGIAEFPNDPGVDAAWSNLADSCAHIGDRECEVRSWHEVLRRRTSDAFRLTPTLNLAEVEMHNGDLKTAIEGYTDAFTMASRTPTENGAITAILAEYGLAVALDRSGEITEAEHAGKLAADMDPRGRLLHSDEVYFVPAYEIDWYDGVTSAGAARAATNPRLRAELWDKAVASFGAYVKAGEANHDRWLPIAKARLAMYIGERQKTEKQLKRLPPEPADPFDRAFGPGPIGPAPQVHNPGTTVIHL